MQLDKKNPGGRGYIPVDLPMVHPEKLRLRLRIPPPIEKKNTVNMLIH